MNIRAVLKCAVVLALTLLPLTKANAKDCPVCGAKDVAELAMFCPECGASLSERQIKKRLEAKAVLIVRLLYTGKNTKHLPTYAKLYINNIYKGNISLIEKQEQEQTDDTAQSWSSGLGKDFFAYYEKQIEGLKEGVISVKLEMRFKRMYGLWRSHKWVEYPYVCLQNGKKTLLEHKFYNASSFGKRSTEKYSQPPPNKLISGITVKGASGTVEMSIPLF